MDRKIYGIFVAGGRGTRMGTDIPKQFLLLDGVSVLQRTIERFVEAVPDINVIVVLPDSGVEIWRQMCLTGSMSCRQTVVRGGITRFHSVKNALMKVPDGAVVMIHDGVRPLVSAALIKRMLALMETERALIPVIPMVDTLRYKDGSEPSPDRSRIVAVQTPQIFISEDIKKAYGQAYSESFTDDASVVANLDIPISMTEGERFNIKITTKEDLFLAQAIISSGNV